jgi:hypothetical protein
MMMNLEAAGKPKAVLADDSEEANTRKRYFLSDGYH